MTAPVAVDWQGDELLARIEQTLATRLDDAAGEVVKDIQGRMNQAGRWNNSRSRPGEPPHRQTGALAESIQIGAASPLSRHVLTDLDYGLWLELGTRDVEPRPFLVPALERARPRLRDRLSARIDP